MSGMDAVDRLTRLYAAGVISINEMRTELGYSEIEGGSEIPALQNRFTTELINLDPTPGRQHVVSTKKVGQSYRVFFDRSEVEALGLEVGDIVEVDVSVVSRAPGPVIDESTVQSLVDSAKSKGTLMVEVRAKQFGAITMDDMITMVYAIPVEYRKNGCFIVNDKTACELRQMKDGKGAYLWQPAPGGKGTESLLGYPVYTSSRMPAVPASNKTGIAAIFGDVDAFLEGHEEKALAKLFVPKKAVELKELP